MARERTFARGEVLPSYVVNLALDALGSAAESFRLTLASATTVQVAAGTGDDTAVLAIDGALRYRTTTVTRAHPGGAAGNFDVYATAAATTISSSPAPNTDTTNRSFDLAITTGGATPTIVAGTVDVFRLIGRGVWNGTAITRLDPLVHDHRSTDPIQATAQVAGQVPIYGRGISGQTAALLALASSAGVDQFTVSNAGIVAALSDLIARSGAGTQTTIGAIGGLSGISFGSAGDTTLYRSAADTLKTDDDFHIATGKGLTIGATRMVEDQVGALAGTSGTPATGNRFVTDADARNTNARTPLAHAASHAPGGTDAIVVPVVTALPASPVDGQLIDLNVGTAAAPVLWRLRYMTSVTDAHKWVFVGGLSIATDATGTFSTTSTSANDTGLTLAVAFAGVYEIEAFIHQVDNSTVGDFGHTLTVSGAGISGANTATVRSGVSANNNWRSTIGFRRRVTLTTGTLQGVVGVTGGTGNFTGRYLRATPLRIS